LCDLAWLQAVCPDATRCDQRSARKLAQRACELTHWESPDCLTVLAAAYGEAGDYNQAVKWQQEAIKQATEDICAGKRREMTLRLKSYRSGMHLHVERIKPLVAHWTFDHANGRALADASGNGHDAQLVGAAKLAPEQVGYALLLGSEGGHVECPDEFTLDLRDEMAISCWIKVATFNSHWPIIITKGDSVLRLNINQFPRRLAFNCAGLTSLRGSGIRGPIELDDEKWHHVVVTFDGQKLYLYVDGRLNTSELVSGRIATNDESISVGALSENSAYCWNGSIDEVRIYTGSLAVDEIRTLYEEEKKVGR